MITQPSTNRQSWLDFKKMMSTASIVFEAVFCNNDGCLHYKSCRDSKANHAIARINRHGKLTILKTVKDRYNKPQILYETSRIISTT
jgi:hypothetical protein